MGLKNYLIEGISGSGKTSVCHELRRRGYHALNGDRDLAYQGDPATGEPPDGPVPADAAEAVAWRHRHHVWDIDKVKKLVADRASAMTFFCGGSRNFARFINLFDDVFVLDIDRATLLKRLAARPHDEFGSQPIERDFVLHLHATQADIPSEAIVIDARAPLKHVVDGILARCE